MTVLVILAGVVLVALAAAAYGRWVVRGLHERAARVAHEVRGPLSAAHLAVHGAARRGELGPVLVAALGFELRRAALALEDPSAARPQDIDLHELLAVQLQTWREIAEIRDKKLTLEPGPGTALVHADALRLVQALSNVVANAIEHGGPEIVIRTVLAGDRIRVEVIDGGPGLPASVAELARRPRAGRGERGRGLAITRAVLAHCGGRIFALSTAPGVAIDLPLDSRSA
jgi:signal transduction histidine kinase